ncbi:MAG: transglutaminaseTgpA domain-containing protein [Candidatus Sumerlaeaceae bacterium]|nr:transglutaminaseTgpA domain-containing protein [Candidatus Sumerlaeaceae bacterium]
MRLWDAYQLLVTLLAWWGALALAITGEVPAQIVIPCLVIPPLAFLARKHLRRIPWWFWDLIVLLIFLRVLPMAKQNLLNATVHFLLALQAIKLLSFRRLVGDAFSIYLVSFFQMFAAALLTTSPSYGLAVFAYLLVLVKCLILHNELVLLSRAQQTEPTSPSFRFFRARPNELDIIGRLENAHERAHTFSFGTPLALTCLIICLSAVFFVMVPRLSTRRVLQTMGAPASPQVTSAFDENIEFGKIGTIQLDTSVAMFVKPLDEGPRPSSVRLRGVALDTFDGQRWERSSWAAYREPFGQFCLRPYPTRRNLIIQPASTSRFIFGETFPFALLSFDFQQALLTDASAGVAWLPYPPAKEIHYTVISRVEDLESREDPAIYQRPSSRQRSVREARSEGDTTTSSSLIVEALQRAGREMGITVGNTLARPGETPQQPRRRSRLLAPDAAVMRLTPDYIFPPYLAACLRIPESLDKDRLRALAQEITKTADAPYAQARAIENYLRQNYEYSLDLPNPGSEQPVEYFLFTSKRGHCEYFATAMAMLLRSLEIPCRVVNGYYCTEWNNIAGMFTVRQRDAHSWVEVFFDGYGWMTFDPTPPSGLQRPTPMNPLLLAFTRYYDALKLRWYRTVIDFAPQDQAFVVRGVLAAFFAVGNAIGALRFENFSSGVDGDVSTWGEFSIIIVTALLVIVVGAIFARRFFSRGRRKTIRKPKPATKALPKFYRDLLASLRKRGFVRDAHETPLEFAKRVAASTNLSLVEVITLWYYGLRYGGEELPANANEILRQLKDELKH